MVRNRPALLPEAIVMSYPCGHQEPCLGPCPTTAGFCVNIYGLCCNKKLCGCLWSGLQPEAMLSWPHPSQETWPDDRSAGDLTG